MSVPGRSSREIVGCVSARVDSRDYYDVVVVGGRVAGSTVAALLADRDVRVLLVERVRFPRSTISTHFFRGAGLIAVLDRLGVLDEVLALGSPRLVRELQYGFASDGEMREAPPQEPGVAGFCLAVRRETLDAILLNRARRSPNVEVVQPASVVSLLRDDGRVVGVRLRESGGERDVRSRTVIGADGRHSVVARAVNASAQREEPASRTLYYRYVRGWRGPSGEEPDAPEFSLREDELAYVFPSDNGLTCVALSANKSEFEAIRSDPESYLRRRFAAHPALAERFAEATPVGGVEGGPPEPSWVRVPYGEGWALVGDAGLHQDPWTGLGMDMAGTHAALLADALGECFAGASSEPAALRRYHEQRDAHGLAPFEETTTLARDLRQLAAP